MREWFIVDGYNVINNWNDFKKIRSENLEHARDLLREKIAEYVAFKGYMGLVVFDAQEVQGSSEEENYGAVTVIYTDEGETADSWIERKTYELNRNGDKVFVVTSDYAEQLLKQAKIWVEAGDNNRATTLYQQALAIKDSAAMALSNTQMEQIKKSYNLDKIELEQQKQTNQIRLISLIVISAILIVLFLSLIHI